MVEQNNNRKKRMIKTAALVLAAVLVYLTARLWYEGAFLPRWVKWEDTTSVSNWTTEDHVKVQSMLWADVDQDGEDELLVLCWKIGRFGSHRPFWEKYDPPVWSQHIFVYKYSKKSEKYRPLWMASNIGVDACNWKYDEVHHRLLIEDPDGQVTAWIWPSWGFEQIDTEISFVAVGDNLIHQNIYEYALENTEGNFDFLFSNVKKDIEEADIAIINQETILVDEEELYGDYPAFGTPVSMAESLKSAGFDVVTVANNHAYDKGMKGIDTTCSALKNQKLHPVGIQPSDEKEYKPYELLWKNGLSFAFLSYTEGTNYPLEDYPYAVHMLDDKKRVAEDIKKAADAADAVIVCVHWGTEDSPVISDSQREWTEFFRENKVDVVIGTHPHVLQDYELLVREDGEPMLVYYSLGNFMSAQQDINNVIGGMARFNMKMTMDGVIVTDGELEKLITHQASDGYTTYKLADYTEELASKHRLKPDVELIP